MQYQTEEPRSNDETSGRSRSAAQQIRSASTIEELYASQFERLNDALTALGYSRAQKWRNPYTEDAPWVKDDVEIGVNNYGGDTYNITVSIPIAGHETPEFERFDLSSYFGPPFLISRHSIEVFSGTTLKYVIGEIEILHEKARQILHYAKNNSHEKPIPFWQDVMAKDSKRAFETLRDLAQNAAILEVIGITTSLLAKSLDGIIIAYGSAVILTALMQNRKIRRVLMGGHTRRGAP